MRLCLFKTLWGHSGPLANAVSSAVGYGFHGIEGQSPVTPHERRELKKLMDDSGLTYIAEIVTTGNYVPDRQASPEVHLASFVRQAETAMELNPLFFTTIAGCDAWSLTASVDLLGSITDEALKLGMVASIETHRSRSLFNPWITREVLWQLPYLKLTCDFSHWCVVAERLVMDTEPDVLALCAKHAHHIHGRVGYDQGPQVPHPAAPEYRLALEAHERWWSAIWHEQTLNELAFSTMTPEFGPDGYLHTLPYTNAPVADLDTINLWMAHREREQFARRRPALNLLAA